MFATSSPRSPEANLPLPQVAAPLPSPPPSPPLHPCALLQHQQPHFQLQLPPYCTSTPQRRPLSSPFPVRSPRFRDWLQLSDPPLDFQRRRWSTSWSQKTTRGGAKSRLRMEGRAWSLLLTSSSAVRPRVEHLPPPTPQLQSRVSLSLVWARAPFGAGALIFVLHTSSRALRL